jgi:hypothetical protein
MSSTAIAFSNSLRAVATQALLSDARGTSAFNVLCIAPRYVRQHFQKKHWANTSSRYLRSSKTLSSRRCFSTAKPARMFNGHLQDTRRPTFFSTSSPSDPATVVRNRQFQRSLYSTHSGSSNHHCMYIQDKTAAEAKALETALADLDDSILQIRKMDKHKLTMIKLGTPVLRQVRPSTRLRPC